MNLRVLKTVYYSVALCLFIWGCGWLIYDLLPAVRMFVPSTYQNIMFVLVGASLCFVVWFGFSPKKESPQVIHISRKVGNPTSLTREQLEQKLWITDPDSKERREILRQLEELD